MGNNMRSMKFHLVSAVLLVGIFVLAAGIHAQTAAKLDVILASQTPYPAEPGGNVNVEIEIQNNGLADATNVNIEIVPSEPLSLIQSEQSSKTFSRISARSSVKVDFDMMVDSSAVSNEYELDFRVYMGIDPTNFVTKSVTVNIQGMPKLILGEIETEPESMEPGGTVKLSIPIENIGTGDAKQLQVTMLSNYSEIVPVLSKGSVYIGELQAEMTKEAEIEIGIDREAEYKIYLATLYAAYKDESNTQHTDSFTLGIPITGSVIIEVIKNEADFSDMELEVEVANKGTADATSIEARLYMNDELVDIDYTSQLRTTKKTTFSFPLTFKGAVLTGSCQIVISYMGPDLKKYEVTKDIVVSPAGQGGSSLSAIALVGILAVVGYLFWKRYFKKKKRKR
jgi:hypothetical protein